MIIMRPLFAVAADANFTKLENTFESMKRAGSEQHHLITATLNRLSIVVLLGLQSASF